MKKLITGIILLSAVAASAAPIKTATYQLGYYGLFTDAQTTWNKNTFKFIVNSIDSITNPALLSGFTGDTWSTYMDIDTTYSLGDYLNMYDWAVSKSVDPEEMLVHAKVDYSSGITSWGNIDKFDNFEGDSGGGKGVIGYDSAGGGTYYDLTTSAYASSTQWKSTMYFGYHYPFDQINIVRTAGSVQAVTWEYWNGSTWAALTTSGTAAALSATGQIAFTPPSTWARTTVTVGGSPSRSKYFVRCNITATTLPTTSSVKGDNWVRGASNLCRGWNASDPAIVNTGELAYNPNAGSGVSATASAKFRYQANVPTWGANHFLYNIADFQTIDSVSKRSMAAWIADHTVEKTTTIPYTGIMYDDAIYFQNIGTLSIDDTDFRDKTANSITVEGLARYQDVYAYIKALKPSLTIGANTYRKDYVKLGDFNIYEPYSYVGQTGSQDNRKLATTDNATNMCYDDYLDSNNPGHTVKGLMIYEDSGNNLPFTMTGQGNRGPITALSKHLIGMNDNTYFIYFTNGSAVYVERDDFFYSSDTSTTLASGITADTSTSPKNISAVDLSAFDMTTGIVIGSGSTREVIRGTSKTGNTITTSRQIYYNHSAGEPVWYIARGHFTTDTLPSLDRMVRWANYFPAMSVDFGTPGTRNLAWLDAAAYRTANPSEASKWTNHTGYGDNYNTNVWSRDFTNALVILRPNGGQFEFDDYITPSAPLPLGGTYYPLNADGTTGAGITSIQLARSQGAILMKAPIGDITPPVTASNVAAGRHQVTQTVTLSSEGGATTTYCLGSGCTPNVTYSAPFKVLQNIALQYLRFTSTDSSANAETVQEIVYRKQRRK